jgi:hypothetical protein
MVFINKFIPINCSKCLHYIKIITSNNIDLSMCKKFKRVSYNFYKIKYEYADFCREDETKCGFIGKHYVEKKN